MHEKNKMFSEMNWLLLNQIDTSSLNTNVLHFSLKYNPFQKTNIFNCLFYMILFSSAFVVLITFFSYKGTMRRFDLES